MNWKLLLALGLVGGAVVVGYVFKTEFSPTQQPPQQTVVVFGEDSSNLKAYSSLRDEFTAKTGLHVQFEGATFEQAVQKADADFRNGTGKYDIVLQYNFSLAPYVRNHYVAKIDEVYSPALLNDLQIDGMFQNALRETSFYYSDPTDLKSLPKQFGLPFAANTMLLVYNRDLFEDPALQQRYRAAFGRELVPPTEWRDYLAVAEFFSKAKPELKGVAMQGAGDGWLYYELANYLFGMGTGTSVKDYGWQEDSALTISTPKNEEALRYYKRLRASSSGDFFTVGASQQQAIMLEGKTAMALVWSDYVQPLAASKDHRFGFAPIPGKVSGLAGGAFYINRKSKNFAAAAQFVLFALAPENQAKLIERGLCSPRRNAYTEEVMTRVPYARALRDSLARGVFMFEADSDAETVNTALTTWVQKYMRGEVSEAEALRQAQNEVVSKKDKKS